MNVEDVVVGSKKRAAKYTRLVGLREWTTTLGLKTAQPYNRQQRGILDNERKFDLALHHRNLRRVSSSKKND